MIWIIGVLMLAVLIMIICSVCERKRFCAVFESEWKRRHGEE